MSKFQYIEFVLRRSLNSMSLSAMHGFKIKFERRAKGKRVTSSTALQRQNIFCEADLRFSLTSQKEPLERLRGSSFYLHPWVRGETFRLFKKGVRYYKAT